MLAADCRLMFTPMIVARQHDDAIIAEIHTPTSVRVLRFNALIGFWEGVWLQHAHAAAHRDHVPA